MYGYNITFYCDKSYKDKVHHRNITNELKEVKNKEQPKNIINEYEGENSSKMLTKVLHDYYSKNKENFEKNEIKNGWPFWPKLKFCVYKLKHFNEDFPFVILYIEDKEKDENNHFRLDFDFKNLSDKNACIYNDSEASEFDISVSKKINDHNNIILIMGYSLTDIYNYKYYCEEEKNKSDSFIFSKKPKIENGLKLYISGAEKDKGFIIGIEHPKEEDNIFIYIYILF